MASFPENSTQDDLGLLNMSKFSEHLHTNYIPSLSEIPEIKAVAASVAREMTLHDSEMKELEAQLARLRTRRMALQVSYDAHMALVSPFRRLPPEIVQAIFVRCLPTNRAAVMHASEAPLLLGRVCSDWRRLLFATPAMWASLHIVPPAINYMVPGSSQARYENKRDLIASWLGRSGSCPLDISFQWIGGNSEEERGLCEILLLVLLPLAKRWKWLNFWLPLQMFDPFEGLGPDTTPALQCFTLVDSGAGAARNVDHLLPWPASLGFVNGATGLRSFMLTVFFGGIHLPSLPFSELTTLSLESTTLFFFNDAHEMLEVLAKCQKLQHCTLKLPLHPTVIQPYEPLDMPTILPGLISLCVDCDQYLENPFHLSNTIGNLITPRLFELELCGRPNPDSMTPGERGPSMASVLQAMLRNSACSLQRLILQFIKLEGTELVECLRLVPTLSYLRVHDWTPQRLTVFENAVAEQPIDGMSEEELLKALTHPPREEEPGLLSLKSPCNDTPVPAICPKLEQFDVSLGNARQKLFRDFAVSRVQNLPSHAVPLKVATCSFTTPKEESIQSQLDDLLQEGLTINPPIIYGRPEFYLIDPPPWTGLHDGP